MPGPKKQGGGLAAHYVPPTPGDHQTIITAVEVAEDCLELPSTEAYLTVRVESVKTPEGVAEVEHRYWTKRGLSRWLAACPKVPVRIDLDRDVGDTNVETARPVPVYYDGFRIDVPKGRTVMVAKPIADVIEQSQKQYRTAQSQGIDLYLIDPNNPDDHGFEIPALAAV